MNNNKIFLIFKALLVISDYFYYLYRRFNKSVWHIIGTNSKHSGTNGYIKNYYTKNPLIVRVFRALGWVEDLGSGTRKIRMYAPLYSKDSKIEIIDNSEFVFSITYAKNTNPAVDLHPCDIEREAFPSFLHEAVYTALKHFPEIKVEEILSLIHTSRRTLYRIIADLRSSGFVKNVGNKNNPKWEVHKTPHCH